MFILICVQLTINDDLVCVQYLKRLAGCRTQTCNQKVVVECLFPAVVMCFSKPVVVCSEISDAWYAPSFSLGKISHEGIPHTVKPCR
jgi:hypothetical protein